MNNFDESKLVDELRKLSDKARIAFAAASATRQLSSCERVELGTEEGANRRPREIATQLWLALQTDPVIHDGWASKLDEVMGLLPEESDDWGIGHALADDALSALAYAIRCLLTADPYEAAWAARRAYEAADQAAIRLLGVQPGLSDTEVAIKSHALVQRELARQQRDIALLQTKSPADSIDEVQRYANDEELLTQMEVASVVAAA